jgi:hypothetical protein
MEAEMRKISIAALAVVLTIFMSCATTAKVVKPGRPLSADSGYIVVRFSNKTGPIQSGIKNIYINIRQQNSGGNLYIPISAGGEIRLIEVTPGDYRINDFVYMVGAETVKGEDSAAEKPGVYYGKPERTGTTLERAKYPEDYLKDFRINAGDIVFLGAYSWDEKLALLSTGITIMNDEDDIDSIGDAIMKAHPNIPETMKLVPVSQRE